MSRLKMTSMLAKSITTIFLDQPPACVLIAPEDPTLIVVGTYLLDPATQIKSGSLQLWKRSADDTSLELISSIDTHAIFDAKFSPRKPNFVATAQTQGLFQTFKLLLDPPRLQIDQTSYLFDPTTSILWLSWHPTRDILACTLSDGQAALIDPGLKHDKAYHIYQAHDVEAWTAEFSPDGQVLYTGGDDSVIHAYDLEMCQTVWRDRKSHGAGVTAIMLRENDNTLLTGSYDDILRVFDSRTRRIVTELEMGGGVWRLDNQGNNSVVVSCMYAGAAVVDLGEGGRSPSIAKKFEEHESMNYGCSIHPSDLNTVVSCSFYDKRLCIWNINS